MVCLMSLVLGQGRERKQENPTHSYDQIRVPSIALWTTSYVPAVLARSQGFFDFSQSKIHFLKKKKFSFLLNK